MSEITVKDKVKLVIEDNVKEHKVKLSEDKGTLEKVAGYMPIATIVIAIFVNWFAIQEIKDTRDYLKKDYDLKVIELEKTRDEFSEQLSLQKEELQQLKDISTIDMLTDIGKEMSNNIDTANIIEIGAKEFNLFNSSNDENANQMLNSVIESMKTKYTQRKGVEIRRAVNQLYDTEYEIRTKAVSQLLNLVSEETAGQILDIMSESMITYANLPDNLMQTNDNGSAVWRSGVYNTFYIVSLFDTKWFGVEFINSEYSINKEIASASNIDSMIRFLNTVESTYPKYKTVSSYNTKTIYSGLIPE